MSDQKSGKKYRNLIFVWNNWNLFTFDLLSKFIEIYCSYTIIGFEVGKECHTPHLQCYFELKKQLSFNQLRELLDKRHFEERIGSQAQAIEYCKKDGNWIQHGTPKKQGKRKDITIAKAIVADGGSLVDVMHQTDSYQAWKAAEMLLKYSHAQTSYNKKQVIWIWGKSGTGKTRTAYTYIGDNSFWRAHSNLRWFDGYYGQHTVLIDDFRSTSCDFQFLLHLLDGYEISCEIKGGFTIWKPKTVLITSPLHPSKYIPHGEEKTQLLRRITKIIQLK